MSKILVVAAATALLATASLAEAKLGANGMSLNGTSLNGTNLNGVTCEGIAPAVARDGAVIVHAVQLKSGTRLVLSPKP